jgi:hypothetical protein
VVSRNSISSAVLVLPWLFAPSTTVRTPSKSNCCGSTYERKPQISSQVSGIELTGIADPLLYSRRQRQAF